MILSKSGLEYRINFIFIFLYFGIVYHLLIYQLEMYKALIKNNINLNILSILYSRPDIYNSNIPAI
jgi:hypothetical protein